MPELSCILFHPAGWLFMLNIGFNIKSHRCTKRKNMFTAFRIYVAFAINPTPTNMGCSAKM